MDQNQFSQNQSLKREEYTLDAIADRIYKAFGLEGLAGNKELSVDGDREVAVCEDFHHPYAENCSYGFISITRNISSKENKVVFISFCHRLFDDVSEEAHTPGTEQYYHTPSATFNLNVTYSDLPDKKMIQIASNFTERGSSSTTGWLSGIYDTGDGFKEWFFEQSGIAFGSQEFIEQRIALFDRKMSVKQGEELKERMHVTRDSELEASEKIYPHNGYNICPAFN